MMNSLYTFHNGVLKLVNPRSELPRTGKFYPILPQEAVLRKRMSSTHHNQNRAFKKQIAFFNLCNIRQILTHMC